MKGIKMARASNYPKKMLGGIFRDVMDWSITFDGDLFLECTDYTRWIIEKKTVWVLKKRIYQIDKQGNEIESEVK